ncbi:MAG: imidazole glycerol phosphate synthase subunit HisH, partial [Vicinamibacteria bacterium]
PGVSGLGLLEGEVRRFGPDLVAPHIGWNQLERIRGEGGLLEGVAEGDFFYFLHSYYAVPRGERAAWAWTEHGSRFCSVAGLGAVSGIQFHPEKSQALGLRVLANFAGVR